MSPRRAFLLTAMTLLLSGAVAFVARTALGPNTLAQEGRFIVDPGMPVDSVVAQLNREGRIEHASALLRYLSCF